MLKPCFGEFNDLCYFMIAHTYVFFVCQPTYYQIQVKATIYQTDPIMNLNYVKVGLSLI